MLVGVLLGPSVFGLLLPDVQRWVFPAESKAVLFAGAQLGLALYMFCVGLEFRVELLRARARAAAAISASGILAPLLLGGAIGWYLSGHPGWFGPTITWQGIPFLGAAMAITAFPMLARIISERGLTGRVEGVLALAAGAIDDAAAWALLACVLAAVQSDPTRGVLALGGGLAFLVLLRLGRPLWAALRRAWEGGGEGRETSFALLLVSLALAAWFTDVIGLYAVFGAFFLGVLLPRGEWLEALRSRIEPLTVRLLLPLFFVYSGLNTRLDLMIGPEIWGVAGLIIVAAVSGKLGACFLAARLSGEDARTSFGIGALMNARGLMELIILNIGLQAGIITPLLFSVMVVMAVATTLMATPLFNLASRSRGAPASP